MAERSLPTMVAIDLGAESCRVSLLDWQDQTPRIRLVHRFANAPITAGDSIHWNFHRILAGVEEGLAACASYVPDAVTSLGVDGWAVDYVRRSHAQPHCYRDARTESMLEQLRASCADEALYARTGAQPLRINTLYQLMADARAGMPANAPWTNLPEYVLTTLGGRRVAEFTNATHTGLVDIARHAWSAEAFRISGLDPAAAPPLVATGTDVGVMCVADDRSSVFAGARLIAPACHDTASAVAGIPLEGDDWAYISSGTWSLVGTLLDAPITTADACRAGFTNQGAAGRQVCFHRNVNGMWLLKQTLAQLCPESDHWPMHKLIEAAEHEGTPQTLLDVDDPALLLPGDMATRINHQLRKQGACGIEESADSLPQFASLIFHSLARCYAQTLREAALLTGKHFRRVAIVGGGSRNAFLNRLTEAATGLSVYCGVAESATVGNFAIQLATWEGLPNDRHRIAHWAQRLADGPTG